ncbi:Gti1/Pac2 family-domain-containing protein [Syncephalis fuscata]|nr:Gti1/Pac2 family-domain-containing protein [Syncephalis fuscata]
METYHGHMRTLRDALMVIEACCLNILPRVRHRLSDRERCLVQSGTVFVWDESETGMRRWTDGRSWSPSRVVNGFLSYRELAGRRQRTPVDSAIPVGRTPNIRSVSRREFRYQPDGLIKRALSFRTTSGRRWHLISYYRESSIINGQLITPSADPRLAHIQLPPGIYPEDLMDQPEDSPINGTNQLIPNRPITQHQRQR